MYHNKINVNEFINRSKNKFGNNFQYDIESFSGMKKEMNFICQIHGNFVMTPRDHLISKYGCPYCAKEKRASNTKKSFAHFISKAKNKFGDKFQYDIDSFNGMKNKMKIICPIHGEFFITPSSFLNSYHGCPECGKKMIHEKHKISLKEFIQKSKEKFGDIFVYYEDSWVEYSKPMMIKCPIHGDIEIIPKKHLNSSYGCPKCGKENGSQNGGKSQEIPYDIFLEKANKKYNNKFVYDEKSYKNYKVNMKIICPIHGQIEITPGQHLYTKYGCPYCACENRKINETKNFDDIVVLANEVHNNKYEYVAESYVNSKHNMKIICPIHGEFLQTPYNHIVKKCGCPKCNQSHIETLIMSLLEKNNIAYVFQQKFEWLKYNGLMSLDFFLPKYDIAIECQGIQHFESIDFFGGEECFKETVKRDERKKQLCIEHNVKLLYYSNLGIEYPYKVFENEEELLKEITNE